MAITTKTIDIIEQNGKFGLQIGTLIVYHMWYDRIVEAQAARDLMQLGEEPTWKAIDQYIATNCMRVMYRRVVTTTNLQTQRSSVAKVSFLSIDHLDIREPEFTIVRNGDGVVIFVYHESVESFADQDRYRTSIEYFIVRN